MISPFLHNNFTDEKFCLIQDYFLTTVCALTVGKGAVFVCIAGIHDGQGCHPVENAQSESENVHSNYLVHCLHAFCTGLAQISHHPVTLSSTFLMFFSGEEMSE